MLESRGAECLGLRVQLHELACLPTTYRFNELLPRARLVPCGSVAFVLHLLLSIEGRTREYL